MLPNQMKLTALVMLLGLCGCSLASGPNNQDDAEEEALMWRTTSCVAGRLPQEILFYSPEKPKRLNGSNFDVQSIDELAEQVDGRIARVLKSSVISAAQNSVTTTGESIYPKRPKLLAERFVEELVGSAPSALEIEFCGEHHLVGSTVYAMLIEYFSRAVEPVGDRWPSWVASEEIRSHRGIIIMLAVSMRLADIEFDPEYLIRGFSIE